MTRIEALEQFKTNREKFLSTWSFRGMVYTAIVLFVVGIPEALLAEKAFYTWIAILVLAPIHIYCKIIYTKMRKRELEILVEQGVISREESIKKMNKK